MNVYGQLAARALFASMFGEESFDRLGIGSFATAGGGGIPDSGYGDLSGIMPTQNDNIARIAEMRNALAGGYNDFNAGTYDAGFRALPETSLINQLTPPEPGPAPGGGGGLMPKKPAKGGAIQGGQM